MVHCKYCDKDLPEDSFTKSNLVRKFRCKECTSDYNSLWYSKNRDKALEYMKLYRKDVKAAVYDHYGRACVCCGETQPLFLDIDRMDNDGSEHRKKYNLNTGTQFYVWLRDQNFPSNFQVLCCNCNRGKFRNRGVCPHKEQHA